MSSKGRASPSSGTALAARLTDGHNGDGRIRDIQRARILAAMAAVSAERGTANVTVAHVVARSGVSRRTFYELFEDREDCFLAALEEGLSRAARYVLPAYEAPGRWVERMRAGLLAALEFLDDEPHLGRLLVVETLGAGARVLRRRREVVSLLLDAVQEGRHESRAASPPPSLTAEGIVGGALSVLHGRLVEPGPEPLRDLTGQLMGMIVLPYLGASAARREIALPLPAAERRRRDSTPANPLHDLSMRLTYRTVRVLGSVATHPGASNRDIGAAADIPDQGQASKLLSRLEKLGLIENQGDGSSRGAPNAWTLTELGRRTHGAIFERQPIPGPAAV